MPAGWRVALTVRGKDYEYDGELAEFGKKFHYGTRGTGGMTHNDPDNRPADVFGGRVTLLCGRWPRVVSAAADHPARERRDAMTPLRVWRINPN